LRRAVLHPTRPMPARLNPLDAAPGAQHLGWFEAGQLVGVGSIGPDPFPLEPDAVAWFLRGMAVAEAWRNRGIGGGLLRALLGHAGSRSADGIVWCQARIPAQRFYARHGFQTIDLIDIPEKGPRYRMRRALSLN
jgi:GNAT superfamily N-acetyltransferase